MSDTLSLILNSVLAIGVGVLVTMLVFWCMRRIGSRWQK